jgi:hypothetical protein
MYFMGMVNAPRFHHLADYGFYLYLPANLVQYRQKCYNTMVNLRLAVFTHLLNDPAQASSLTLQIFKYRQILTIDNVLLAISRLQLVLNASARA